MIATPASNWDPRSSWILTSCKKWRHHKPPFLLHALPDRPIASVSSALERGGTMISRPRLVCRWSIGQEVHDGQAAQRRAAPPQPYLDLASRCRSPVASGVSAAPRSTVWMVRNGEPRSRAEHPARLTFRRGEPRASTHRSFGVDRVEIAHGLADSTPTADRTQNAHPNLRPKALPTPQQIRYEERASLLNSLLAASGIALVMMAAVSLYLGWLVAGRVLQPVHTITATARRLSQDTLHERIGLTGPRDELTDLADTFDAMLARLSSAFESQRRFIANASHELRSPLAEQRALVDVSLSDPGITRDQLREALLRIRDTTDKSNQLAAGTGLGLSIVRSATLAHGGTVHAEARAEGGLAITVTLPAS